VKEEGENLKKTKVRADAFKSHFDDDIL